MSTYEKILKPITAHLGYADCSMVDFAQAIRTCVETELEKINSDQALIALLLNAARIGWELIEKSKVNDKIAAGERFCNFEPKKSMEKHLYRDKIKVMCGEKKENLNVTFFRGDVTCRECLEQTKPFDYNQPTRLIKSAGGGL